MNDREMKIHALLKSLMQNPMDMQVLRRGLDAAGVGFLRHVEAMTFPEVTDPVRIANAEDGILLDVETTGVDTAKDLVIQLAMRKFRFDAQGIISVGEVFDQLNDPGIPIPPEVTKLTRITDEDVKGRLITEDSVREFVGENVRMVLCHNAGFDRKMVERAFPTAGFEDLRFDCSLTQVNWLMRGNNGRSLELLAMRAGFVYGSHNALNDINVMPFVLNRDDPEMGTPFAEMAIKGDAPHILLVAEGSAFSTKDILKANGYVWSADGVDACGYKAWFKVLDDDPEILALEATFLKEKVYGRDVSLPAFRVMPDERYSARKPRDRITFRTAEVTSISEALQQQVVNPVLEQTAFGF